MPRYFFDLWHAHLHVSDRRGEACADPGEAVEFAMVAVLDLVTQEGRHRDWSRWSIQIRDENGERVAVLPFTVVLKGSSCDVE